jgi:hypothetical protein
VDIGGALPEILNEIVDNAVAEVPMLNIDSKVSNDTIVVSDELYENCISSTRIKDKNGVVFVRMDNLSNTQAVGSITEIATVGAVFARGYYGIADQEYIAGTLIVVGVGEEYEAIVVKW